MIADNGSRDRLVARLGATLVGRGNPTGETHSVGNA